MACFTYDKVVRAAGKPSLGSVGLVKRNTGVKAEWVSYSACAHLYVDIPYNISHFEYVSRMRILAQLVVYKCCYKCSSALGAGKSGSILYSALSARPSSFLLPPSTRVA